MPIYPLTEVNEDSSAEITFQIVDKTRTGIDVINIATAIWTLKNRYNKAVINARTDISFLADIDSNGYAVIQLTGDDNPIVTKSTVLKEEIHIMTVKVVTTTSPVLTIVEEIWIKVLNLEQT